MAVEIRLRRDTTANWTAANPILDLGEPAFDTLTQLLKVGDGVTRYLSLPSVTVGPQGPAGTGTKGADGSNVLPTDTAIAQAATTAGSATKLALDAVYNVPGRPSNVVALSASNARNTAAASTLQSVYLALANWQNAPFDIGVLGDSIVEGYGNTTTANAWRSQFMYDLRRRNGQAKGGRGFIAAFQTNSISPTPPTWPCVLTGNVTFGSDFYGVKRYVAAMNSTGVATFSLQGTSADIVYPVDSGFGTMTYSVDGGSAVTINQAITAAADGVRTRVSLGASGPHTLVVRGITAGSYLEGVIEYDGDETTGIRVHDNGHGGYRSDQWSTGGIDGVKYWPAALKSMNYGLLIIALGVNDVAQGIPVATYKTNMISLLSTLRSFYTGPIVFVDYAAVQNQDAAWPSYIQAMYELAASDGKALVADLSLRMPAYSQAANHSAWFDSNHPTDMGHALIGKLVASFISPS